MAIIKAVSSRASISTAIDYVTKEEKTEEKLVSGIECSPETAKEEMKATKELWGKTEGRQYKHFVHSFPPDEKITPEQAHELAKELCAERFKGHEVLIATHKDKEHIHSHIIVNSVNYENGYKLQWSNHDLQQMIKDCNEISREHGLSVPVKGEEITANTLTKYKALERSITGDYKSYVLDCYKAADTAKQTATSREDFIVKMKEQGFEIKWTDNRKYITFTDKDGNKVRNSNLEKTFKEPFAKDSLEHEFEKNIEVEQNRAGEEPPIRKETELTEEFSQEVIKEQGTEPIGKENIQHGAETKVTTEHSRTETERVGGLEPDTGINRQIEASRAENSDFDLDKFKATIEKSRTVVSHEDGAGADRIVDEPSNEFGASDKDLGIDKLNATIGQSKDAVRRDDSAKADRIANEQSRNSQLHRGKEQGISRTKSQSFDLER